MFISKKNIFVVFCTGLLFLASCSTDDVIKDDITNPNPNNLRTLVDNGLTRYYDLNLPADFDETASYPLMINFHGFGGDAEEYSANIENDYNMEALVDSEQFITVYPQGVIRAKGAPEWDPGDNGSQNIEENDVYFTEMLIQQLHNQFNIDLSRVYAVGYSNGGMMAYGLACSRSDLIAAAGIMSGIMLGESCDGAGTTPIIHFHGVEDEVLPYEGNADYQSVSSVVDIWLDQNNIPASSLVSTSLRNGDVIRDVYTGGDEGSEFVLYTINNEFEKGGGHVWFSESIDGSTPNEILWDFLSRFTL